METDLQNKRENVKPLLNVKRTNFILDNWQLYDFLRFYNM